MRQGIARAIPSHEWIYALATVFAIKLCWLAADSTIRIFLGDSGAYLYYALILEAPPDRSYTYPLLLHWVALPWPSFGPMLALQTLFGSVTALLVFGIARGMFATRFAIALALAALLATEPSQIIFERMIMAESAGTLCFAAAITSGIAYVLRPHPRWLIYGAILGVGTVSFRLSLLPVVLGMTLLPPAVAHLFRRGQRLRALRSVAAAAFVLVLTGGFHSLYQRWYAEQSTAAEEPTYIHREGAMRLSLVAPLVQAKHLAGYGLPPDLLDTVGPSLRNPDAREAQLWAGDGLVLRIAQHTNEPERIARKIAMRALRDDIPGWLALQWHMTRSYFNDEVANYRIIDDLGWRGPDAGVVDWMRAMVDYDGEGIAQLKTPAWLAFAHSRWWLTLCLFGVVPLAAVATWRCRPPLRPAALYLGLVALGMTAAHLLFSMIVSYRYLHAFPFVVLLVLALLIDSRWPDRNIADA